jgi:hypothetical protein
MMRDQRPETSPSATALPTAEDQTTARERTKTPSLFQLIAVSYFLFNFGIILMETLNWTNKLHGFINGLIVAAVFGTMFWGIVCLPWMAIVAYLYHGEESFRFRTPTLLLPTFIALAFFLFSLATSFPTPENRFESRTETPLPKPADNLIANIEGGGGLADFRDSFYFETSRDQTEKLISTLELKGSGKMKSEPSLANNKLYRQLTGMPDFRTWPSWTMYRRDDEEANRYYLLITNSTRTRVIVSICCI